ncbi:pilus assembly FimT family protein [Pseudoxanthomonas jiangsuensis]|uniref:pilus assembly FimT family protein n=1 Tax=Pseudoxanthomonas jiangsuensis TaxID=619688 RepID=UPI0013911988|nr:type II secretion system protein [Pseudoxanthomonas jiangsuensis]
MTPVRGYTLLEMMVVVALLALATGMVAPAGYRMITTWREASEVEQVMHAIAALPLLARNQGRTLQLDSTPAEERPLADASGPPQPQAGRIVDLPEGWQLRMDTPLTVSANGACSGAEGTLQTERQSIPFQVQAPFCRVRRIAASGG